MRLIDLFNQEDPQCLYCGGRELDISYPSVRTPKGQIFNCDRHFCKWCEEKFVIMWLGEDKIESNIFQFNFTCDGFVLQQTTGLDTLSLYKTIDNPIIIPFFVPDFSDKQKLLDKLKTYALFS
jgi:hypothetical protein